MCDEARGNTQEDYLHELAAAQKKQSFYLTD